MASLTLLLIFLANVSWILVYLSLIFTSERLNAAVAWTGFSVAFEPAYYIPHLLVVAFATQLLLLGILYWMKTQGSFLRTKYKKIKGEHGELLSEHKNTIQEQSSRLSTLEQENEKLMKENQLLLARLEKTEQPASSLMEKFRSWFGKKKM